MKKIKILLLMILVFILNLKSNRVYANSDDIYDVILFWGQSNMAGAFSVEAGAGQEDSRYSIQDINSLNNFSEKTGIDIEILKKSVWINRVQIEQVPGTVFEYKYLTNELSEISKDTYCLGEKLCFDSETQKLSNDGRMSLQGSAGTNMIPEFGRVYYEKTGHKVVAVFAAYGAQQIQAFLPSSDPDYNDKDNKMMYEAIVEKYNATIKYLNDNQYNIGNKLYVVFQGESNVTRSTKDEYKRLFLKVHNNLKNDLGITKGGIVETSYTIGISSSIYEQIKNLHQAQEELIQENEDIILGSSYSYDRYVPNEETYNSDNYENKVFFDDNGEKLNYLEAFENASYSVNYPNNTIHFTSAALSQIGREVAESFSKIIDVKILKNPSKINYIKETEQLDLNNGVIQVTYNNGSVENISMTDKRIKIEGFNNKIIGKNEITLNFFDNILKFKINIIPKGKELENGNTLIADFNIETKVSDVINNKSWLDYTVKVFDENNKDISNEENRLLGTGCIINIYDKQEKNNLIKSYNTVIFGDVNGDSSINAIDALIIVKNKLGTEKLKNEACNEAGKVSVISREENSVPSSKDALCVVKYKLDSKQYPISQQMFYDV